MPYYLQLLLINLRSSLAQRSAFILRSLFMFANNLIFLCTWFILYTRVDTIGGWGLNETLLIYALTASGFGLCGMLAAGVRALPEYTRTGALDTFLVQPRSVLLQVIGSRSEPSAWGDFLTAFVLIPFTVYGTPDRLPILMAAVVCCALMFLATSIIAYSLVLWIRESDEISHRGSELVIAFSLYPESIYDGFTRLFLYTVIPVGFVAFIPVQLVREFSWEQLAFLLFGVATYLLLAAVIFQRGLTRYESASRIGTFAA